MPSSPYKTPPPRSGCPYTRNSSEGPSWGLNRPPRDFDIKMQTPISLTGQLESPHRPPSPRKTRAPAPTHALCLVQTVSKQRWPVVQPSDSKGSQPLRICMKGRCAGDGHGWDGTFVLMWLGVYASMRIKSCVCISSVRRSVQLYHCYGLLQWLDLGWQGGP
jgi:hypothetical protein